MSKGTSVVPVLPMAALLALSVEELLKFAKDAVNTADKAKSYADNHKASFSAFGKVIAALKKRFNAESQANSLVSTMTFAEFFELKTGGKVNNHANECARTFGFFVDNGMMTEKDYDDNPTNNLEQAARVVTAIKGDLTHAGAQKAADILKSRPKDAAKQLASLVESIEGPKQIEHEKAKEQLVKIFASGHLELVLAMAGAEVRELKDETKQHRVFQHLTIALDGCGTPELQEKWLNESAAAQTPPQLIGNAA